MAAVEDNPVRDASAKGLRAQGERPAKKAPLHGASGWLGAAVSALACLAASAAFLPRQALWSDEAASMEGLRHNPVEVLQWLPIDKNPPLFYWVGWIWSQAFGPTELSMRWLGALLTCAAAVFVFLTARKLGGEAAGWVAGLGFALSPNTIVDSVEIRTYPLFMLLSAVALNRYVALLKASTCRTTRQWFALGTAVALAAYTHVFGFLLAGALLSTLGIWEVFHRRTIKPLLMIGTVLVLQAVSLMPVMAGGVDLPKPKQPLHDLVRLGYRLVAHNAMSVRPVVLVAVLAGTLGLLVGAAMSREARAVRLLIVSAVALGLLVCLVAHLSLKDIFVAQPKYVPWVRQAGFILLGGGFALVPSWQRLMVKLAAGAFLVGHVVSAAELARHGDYFSHGPQRRISEILDAKSVPTAVIYESSPNDAWQVHRPLRFERGADLSEFKLEPEATMPLVQPLNVSSDPTWPSRLHRFERLLIVRARWESASQVVQQLRDGPKPFPRSRLPQELAATGLWEEATTRVLVGTVTAEVAVLERRSEPRGAWHGSRGSDRQGCLQCRRRCATIGREVALGAVAECADFSLFAWSNLSQQLFHINAPAVRRTVAIRFRPKTA